MTERISQALRGDILKAQTWEGHSEKVVGIFSNLTYATVFEVAEHESEVRFWIRLLRQIVWRFLNKSEDEGTKQKSHSLRFFSIVA